MFLFVCSALPFRVFRCFFSWVQSFLSVCSAIAFCVFRCSFSCVQLFLSSVQMFSFVCPAVLFRVFSYSLSCVQMFLFVCSAAPSPAVKLNSQLRHTLPFDLSFALVALRHRGYCEGVPVENIFDNFFLVFFCYVFIDLTQISVPQTRRCRHRHTHTCTHTHTHTWDIYSIPDASTVYLRYISIYLRHLLHTSAMYYLRKASTV